MRGALDAFGVARASARLRASSALVRILVAGLAEGLALDGAGAARGGRSSGAGRDGVAPVRER